MSFAVALTWRLEGTFKFIPLTVTNNKHSFVFFCMIMLRNKTSLSAIKINIAFFLHRKTEKVFSFFSSCNLFNFLSFAIRLVKRAETQIYIKQTASQFMPMAFCKRSKNWCSCVNEFTRTFAWTVKNKSCDPKLTFLHLVKLQQLKSTLQRNWLRFIN